MYLKFFPRLLDLYGPFRGKRTRSEKRGSPAINNVEEFLKGLDLSSLKGDDDDVNCERPRACQCKKCFFFSFSFFFLFSSNLYFKQYCFILYLI